MLHIEKKKTFDILLIDLHHRQGILKFSVHGVWAMIKVINYHCSSIAINFSQWLNRSSTVPYKYKYHRQYGWKKTYLFSPNCHLCFQLHFKECSLEAVNMSSPSLSQQSCTCFSEEEEPSLRLGYSRLGQYCIREREHRPSYFESGSCQNQSCLGELTGRT